MPQPRLELRNITKRYPAVVANDGVSLSAMPGEIHAVLGENGAGKSTLMKIIYGAAKADSGEILWDGAVLGAHSPSTSRAIGIEMVYQHFALFESVSVAENIAVAVNEPFDLNKLSKRIEDVSQRYGLLVDPRRLVHHLSVGERQRVEIVRCLVQNPRLLILDEPTSVLTPQAIRQLFETLRALAREGCSILYISHKLHEVKELCQSATVLKNGRVTGAFDPRKLSEAAIARMMVGSDLPHTHRGERHVGTEPALQVRNLSAVSPDPFGVDLDDVSLDVYPGEIVGIAGVSGNGQRELVAFLSGEMLASEASMITLGGKPAGRLNAAWRRNNHMAFVPEERLGRGAVPPNSLTDNAALTAHRLGMVRHGFLSSGKARDYAKKVIERFNVKASGAGAAAQSLSGGNLQKFIVGREIELAPRVFLVSQPTWGVDVGASAFIRQTIIDLSRSGAAVLVLSEELDELFEICDRLLVICNGRLSQSIPRARAKVEDIGLLMTGHGKDSASLNHEEALIAS